MSGLHSGYGRIPILAGVTLRSRQARLVGILGHNGMGKTTLLRTLMGYLPATAGASRSTATTSRACRPRRGRGCGVGYVPQGREIFATLSVAENLRWAACASPTRGPRSRRSWRISRG